MSKNIISPGDISLNDLRQAVYKADLLLRPNVILCNPKDEEKLKVALDGVDGILLMPHDAVEIGKTYLINRQKLDEEILNSYATNGDMIKAMFPNVKTRDYNNSSDFIEYTFDGIVGNTVEKSWWDAPYKSERKGKRMNNVEKVKEKIKAYYKFADCGIFNSRNILGDTMGTIYEGEGLTIDICYHWAYFEVFGLSDTEFEELKRYYYSLKLAENEVE